MINAQQQLHAHLGDVNLAAVELAAIQEYKSTHEVYVSFLSQKAKMDWLREGDENTKLFHQSIKARKVENQVFRINDKNGCWHDTSDFVAEAFLGYYKKLLGYSISQRTHVFAQIVQSSPLYLLNI